MNPNMLQQMMGMGGMGRGIRPVKDLNLADTSGQVYISSLALLKMLKHGRAGVPLEVMGLLLGEFVDDYSIKVVDVFAMPQRASSVSVDSIDPAFQSKMIEMLKQTHRNEIVVGWYHSHPTYGPWLSGTDINTQMSFEQLNEKCVAIVIDPIQTVKGKNELEQKMLLNLYKKKWSQGLKLEQMDQIQQANIETMKSMAGLAEKYTKWVEDQMEKTKEEMLVDNVGKINPVKHINQNAESLMSKNIVQSLGTMLNTKAF